MRVLDSKRDSRCSHRPAEQLVLGVLRIFQRSQPAGSTRCLALPFEPVAEHGARFGFGASFAWIRGFDNLAVTAGPYGACMKPSAQSTGRPSRNLTLVPLADEARQDPVSVTIEQGLHCEEVVLITVPRDRRLLEELRLRLGDRMRAYRVTPETLTFSVSKEKHDSNLIPLIDPSRECVW